MSSQQQSHYRRLAAVAAVTGGLFASLFAGASRAADPKPAAADAKAEAAKPAALKKAGPKYAQMDYGPYLSASIISDPRAKFDNGPGSYTGDSTARGFAIKLSEDWKDGIVFDSDLMRMSAGWLDGGLKLVGLIADGGHGVSPTIANPPLFQTPHLPGWAGPDGSFADPRPNSIDPLPPVGPLPKIWSHYKGLYRHGDQVVLSYTVGSADVLELPSVEKAGETKALVRTIRIEKSDKPLTLMIADVDPFYPFLGAKKKANIDVKPPAKKGEPAAESSTTAPAVIRQLSETSFATETVAGHVLNAELLNVGMTGAPNGATLGLTKRPGGENGSQFVLRLPAIAAPVTFKVYIAAGGDGTNDAFVNLVKASAKPIDLVPLTKGGPSLWKETVETKGVLGKAKETDAYVVDNLTLPDNNPYGSWMRIGAFDFFPDGKSAALSTWSGDVWIVSGIDDSLEKLTWKRFATGLHQPLGLKIQDGKIYTVGHDQITRLNDLDGDGEADFYENFNADWELTTAFHAFCFDLQADKEENFYFAFGAPVHAGGGGFQKITAHHGTLMKVNKDGSKLDVVATGFRAPNGIGLNVETGQLTTGDNEGTWVPKSPINWVKPGSFNGVVDAAHRPMKSTDAKSDPSEQPKPLVWLPKNVDNSGGGQVWVTSDKWGPFKGDLLHLSYGTSTLFKVLYEEVDGQVQGGVVKIPVKFGSSAMRARFSDADGQLYVTGLKGWQTNAGKDGGFDRVRYTGNPVRLPSALKVTPTGVAITFTAPLDKASAEDAQNYDVEVWKYLWTGGYGSGEYSTMDESQDPSKKPKSGKDPLTVKSAKLSEDGKTVTLEVEGIKPVMQMKIDYNISAADKTPLKDTIHNTIHNLPKP